MTPTGTAIVDEPKRKAQDSGMRGRKRAPIADRKAREFLRKADPVLAPDRRPSGLPSARLDGRTPSARRVRNAHLPNRRTAAVRERDAGHPVSCRGALRRAFAVTGRASRRGSARAAQERDVDPKGSDAASARGAVRRRTPQQRGVRANDRRRGRGSTVVYGVGGTVATAATLVYHAISLWVPAVSVSYTHLTLPTN